MPKHTSNLTHRRNAPPMHPQCDRVGRTARMGRSGAAVALLLPSETTYIELLKLRKIPLTEGEKMEGACRGWWFGVGVVWG